VNFNECFAKALPYLNLLGAVLLAIYGYYIQRKLIWVKTEVTKEVFAHNKRLDNAFEVYRYLWHQAAHFADAIIKLFEDPLFPSSEGPHPESLQRAMEKIMPITRGVYEVKETLLNNSPFISDEVKEKASELINLYDKYIIRLQEPNNYEEIKSEVTRCKDNLDQAIREQTSK
jgi:hypothetical protein